MPPGLVASARYPPALPHRRKPHLHVDMLPHTAAVKHAIANERESRRHMHDVIADGVCWYVLAWPACLLGVANDASSQCE